MAGLFEQIKKNTKEQLPAEWAAYLKPGTAQYEAAVLLNAQGKLPKIVIDKTDKDSYNAQFSPEENTVTINPNTTGPALPNAIAHELTHALNTVIKDQVFSWRDTGKSPTGVDAQFLEAWRKLHPGDSKLKEFTYPSFGGEDFNAYRYSIKEKPAFAVGRMEDPRQSLTKQEYWMSSPGGSHVDATLAQEQAILRDLQARRIQQEQQPSTPWYKDPFGFTIK